MPKGRKIMATVDVWLVQISDEEPSEDANYIVKEWCDQVQSESLYVKDDNAQYEAKFDVDTVVVVRVMDPTPTETLDVDDSIDMVVDGQ